MRRMQLFLGLLFAMLPSLSFAWQGKVVRVSEGDTLTIVHSGSRARVRLYGVDAPERKQEFSEKAKLFAAAQVYGRKVEVRPLARDASGGEVSLVYVGEKCLNEELVKAGWAWVHTEFCTQPFCRYLERLEENARAKGLGLWAASDPKAPWDFRRQRKPSKADVPDVYTDLGQRVEAVLYRGDVATHIFHTPECQHYECKGCIAVFRKREEVVRAGYKPCELCHP